MSIKVPPVVGIAGNEQAPIAGMGVVIDERHVLTCAHVVSQAVGGDALEQARPDTEVCVRFVLDSPREPAVGARVAEWLPPRDAGDNEDIALLALNETADVDIGYAAFSVPRINEPVRAFGLPTGVGLGTWWRGLISLPVRSNRFQLDQSERAKVSIEPGYSGTPLLSINGARAYGIVARVRGHVGYMIPSQELDRVYKVTESPDPTVAEFANEESLAAAGDTAVASVTTATERQDSMIEVDVNADTDGFSDDDAYYFQKMIEYMQGFPRVKLTVSYIRRGTNRE